MLYKDNKPVTPSYLNCHTGTKEVFKADNLTFYGGGSTRGIKLWRNAIWLNCTGCRRGHGSVEVYGLPPLPVQNTTQREIVIDWPDYETPDTARRFWQSIVELFQRESNGHPLDIIVFCEGGHGRTGTALAILAGLLLGKREPISFIRTVYCHMAVESMEQEEYVARVTGYDEDLTQWGRSFTATRQWWGADNTTAGVISAASTVHPAAVTPSTIVQPQENALSTSERLIGGAVYSKCKKCSSWIRQDLLYQDVCVSCEEEAYETQDTVWETCDVCQKIFAYTADAVIGSSIVCPECQLEGVY